MGVNLPTAGDLTPVQQRRLAWAPRTPTPVQQRRLVWGPVNRRDRAQSPKSGRAFMGSERRISVVNFSRHFLIATILLIAFSAFVAGRAAPEEHRKVPSQVIGYFTE